MMRCQEIFANHLAKVGGTFIIAVTTSFHLRLPPDVIGIPSN